MPLLRQSASDDAALDLRRARQRPPERGRHAVVSGRNVPHARLLRKKLRKKSVDRSQESDSSSCFLLAPGVWPLAATSRAFCRFLQPVLLEETASAENSHSRTEGRTDTRW